MVFHTFSMTIYGIPCLINDNPRAPWAYASVCTTGEPMWYSTTTILVRHGLMRMCVRPETA